MTKIGVLMIATNKYVELWKNVARDFDRLSENSRETAEYKIYLHTDKIAELSLWIKSEIRFITIELIEIPNYRWPLATLLRYSIFTENEVKYKEELLMYLDSDMKIIREFISELNVENWSAEIALVRHPGFYRPKFSKVRSDIRYLWFKYKLFDIRYLIGNCGQPGTWEKSKKSSAYVPARHRNCYVHGAVWFGKRESFLNLCKILDKNVFLDLANGYIAIWHDESHLNWYAANFNVYILDNRFSHYEEFKLLYEFEPIISSLSKNNLEIRDR